MVMRNFNRNDGVACAISGSCRSLSLSSDADEADWTVGLLM